MLFIDYPADISRYINVPGRVCAKPCGSLVCDKVGEVCQEQAESSPQCVCPGEYTLICLRIIAYCSHHLCACFSVCK